MMDMRRSRDEDCPAAADHTLRPCAPHAQSGWGEAGPGWGESVRANDSGGDGRSRRGLLHLAPEPLDLCRAPAFCQPVLEQLDLDGCACAVIECGGFKRQHLHQEETVRSCDWPDQATGFE